MMEIAESARSKPGNSDGAYYRGSKHAENGITIHDHGPRGSGGTRCIAHRGTLRVISPQALTAQA